MEGLPGADLIVLGGGGGAIEKLTLQAWVTRFSHPRKARLDRGPRGLPKPAIWYDSVRRTSTPFVVL